MLRIGLLVVTVFCAIQAVRAARLLAATLWLAGVSVFIAIAFYAMGAREVAVIELSVGAGLVTVLMVFAITISGEDAMKARALVPRPLALGLVALSILLLGWLTLPALDVHPPSAEASFAIVLWQHRGLDALLQIGLIFAGVLGVLGLLSEAKTRSKVVEPGALEPANADTKDSAHSDGLPRPEAESEDKPVLEEQIL